MESDPVKLMHRRHFIETCATMSEWSSTGRGAQACQEHRRVAAAHGDGEKEHAFISEWHDRMQTPLSLHGVKYANALRRILKVDAVSYHACEYRDMPALADAMRKHSFFESLQIVTLLQDSPQLKDQFWEFVMQLNRHAQQYFGVAVLAPSRSEIRENIQMHKATRVPAKSAMVRGFDGVFEELCALRNVTMPDHPQSCKGVERCTGSPPAGRHLPIQRCNRTRRTPVWR